MNEQFKQPLNEIATYLSEGEAWHRKVANELRKMPNKRGFARVHDGEGLCDSKLNFEFVKVLRDQIQYTPVIDTNYLMRVENYMINDFEGFKQHFRIWVDREAKFLKSITAAIDYARTEDMEIYGLLCKLSKEVKNEAIRAQWIHDSLADAEWHKHHCAIVSYLLHEYAEKHPGETDWNIG